MRQPSTAEQKWGWWESAVAGLPVPMHERDPQVGYYRIRRWARKDYWLAAHIWIEPGPVDPETGELIGPEQFRAEVDGKSVDPYGIWTWLAGHPIELEDYEWLKATRPLQPNSPPQPKSSR
jgi:hypothetical protein